MFSRELKKGSTEMLVLSLLETRARHGYQIGKQIETSSGGRLDIPHRLPLPHPLPPRRPRADQRTLVERPGERRRRYYRLTPAGRRALEQERTLWRQFVLTIASIVGDPYA